MDGIAFFLLCLFCVMGVGLAWGFGWGLVMAVLILFFIPS